MPCSWARRSRRILRNSLGELLRSGECFGDWTAPRAARSNSSCCERSRLFFLARALYCVQNATLIVIRSYSGFEGIGPRGQGYSFISASKSPQSNSDWEIWGPAGSPNLPLRALGAKYELEGIVPVAAILATDQQFVTLARAINPLELHLHSLQSPGGKANPP